MAMKSPIDSRFRVETLNATLNPQTTVWCAMHQDYSEEFVFDETAPSEKRAGEIIVKRLLSGEKGHYGCYSADTEVLTANGWVKWPNVEPSMALAAVDIETGAIRFEHPTGLQRVPFADGDKLYCLQSQKLDMAVTQDHRMAVSHHHKSNAWSNWHFTTAAEVAGRTVRYRLAGELQERKIPDDCPSGVDLVQLFKIAGFFFGYGCRSKNQGPGCLRLGLRQVRKIAYRYSYGFDIESKQSDRLTLKNSKVAEWVHRHFATENGKAIPSFVMHLPVALFEAFADGLRNSDGTPKGATWALDSTEKASLDILQAAFHLNGQAASLSLNNPNEDEERENHTPSWRIHISCHEPFALAEVGQKGGTRGSEQLLPYQGDVYCATVSTGALLVRRNGKPVVCGNCLEHPQITLNAGWFPHSVMQQARTHRVGVSFDCQSFRYTSERILNVASGKREIEEVFYLRPEGFYSDRQGKKYEYTKDMRIIDIARAYDAAGHYAHQIRQGMAEEQARGLLPFDTRQHFVVSFSLRALLHFLDLRSKLDAQMEIRHLCDLMWPHLQVWTPDVAEWYKTTRLHKARLAP
jgi:thymidylate synthase (FAD)